MIFFYFLFLISTVAGSHYRGGSISWTIRSNTENLTNNQVVPVRITQRHSWRRSHYFCNDTSPNSANIIGEDVLTGTRYGNSSSFTIPYIDARVRCTDYNEEFDYSSGENSTTIFLPINQRIEYIYTSCCWIPLLPPDIGSNWALKVVINTYRRLDGNFNNSPKTTMNPIVQLQTGKTHVIRIPMADSDGDKVRCQWGQTQAECGDICSPKGFLSSDPCELTYNASHLGYQAIALIIQDFDSNDNVLSSIPLQFLIHIVNETIVKPDESVCPDPPVYVGDWPQNSCIGVESNTTINVRIQIRIPCVNTSTILKDMLTVSPTGLNKGVITRDSIDPTLYTMSIDWTPSPNQYGIQQLCLTPVDSQHQTGSQVCLTFQVDIRPPEFVLMTPTGIISSSQASWTIEADHDIIRPRRTSGVYIRFFKQSNNQEVYRIDAATDLMIIYQPRQITFYTTGFTFEQGEVYYILLDSGIATINESCGVESAPITDPHVWVFRVAKDETITVEGITTTKQMTSTATQQIDSTTPTTPLPRPACPRWLPFNTISNESTSANEPFFIFCFSVETSSADVTISANTWVPCMIWKLSGASDPLMDLYSESTGDHLAQNDDGNSHVFNNCYASVLSYRLQRGDYRVIIRNPKCAYGKFELRLSAEIDRNTK